MSPFHMFSLALAIFMGTIIILANLDDRRKEKEEARKNATVNN